MLTTKKSLLSLVLALILTFTLCVPAFAAADAPADTPSISMGEQIAAVLPTQGEDQTDEDTTTNDAQAVLSDDEEVPTVTDNEPEVPEVQEEAAPAPRRSNNTPYFIGALVAVIMFIGVALYCKVNGNK